MLVTDRHRMVIGNPDGYIRQQNKLTLRPVRRTPMPQTDQVEHGRERVAFEQQMAPVEQ